MGKGNKKRIIPIGKQVQRLLWRYISRFRPEPALPKCDLLFLTQDGTPLTKDRVEKIMACYGMSVLLPLQCWLFFTGLFRILPLPPEQSMPVI